MLNPSSWPDTNDSFSLSVHKNKYNLKTLLALCFAHASEKYHHWHVFARGNSGVCIVFKYDDFVHHMSGIPGITCNFVEYLLIREYERRVSFHESVNLPFIKRFGYKDEKEYRVIYEDINDIYETKDIDIPLSVIDRIEVNPWIPEPLFKTTRELLLGIADVDRMLITQSQLINNKRWKELAGL